MTIDPKSGMLMDAFRHKLAQLYTLSGSKGFAAMKDYLLNPTSK